MRVHAFDPATEHCIYCGKMRATVKNIKHNECSSELQMRTYLIVTKSILWHRVPLLSRLRPSLDYEE